MGEMKKRGGGGGGGGGGALQRDIPITARPKGEKKGGGEIKNNK